MSGRRSGGLVGSARVIAGCAVLVTAVAIAVVPASAASAATGQWSQGPSLSGSHTKLIPLGDGRVLAAGGGLSAPEAYSPITNSWAAVAPDPANLSPTVAVELSDGRALMVGAGVAETFSPVT